MMAIHHTLATTPHPTYRDEPTHIFTNNLNVLYLLNTWIKHPTLHNSHPNKKIIEGMIKMLISHTQIPTLHKMKAHTNINGNEQADAQAKHGHEQDHRDAATPYEHAHPISYYFQKDWWHSMQETPYKGPIRHLGKYILRHDQKKNKKNLAIIANQTYQLHK